MGKLAEGWTLSGVTTIQNGSPMTITDSRGGSVFGAPTSLSTAQFCTGMGNANALTSGSLQQRVINGLNGGNGYLNGTTQGVFCGTPVLASTGLAGTGFGNAGLGIVLGPPQDNRGHVSRQDDNGRRYPGRRYAGIPRLSFSIHSTHPQFSNPNVTAVNAGGYGADRDDGRESPRHSTCAQVLVLGLTGRKAPAAPRNIRRCGTCLNQISLRPRRRFLGSSKKSVA